MDKAAAMRLFIQDIVKRVGVSISAQQLDEDDVRIRHPRYNVTARFCETAPTPDTLKAWMPFTDDHMLIIVNRDLLPEAGEVLYDRPLWLQILHALYYGRVYAYTDTGTLMAMHLERRSDGAYVVSYCPHAIHLGTLRASEIDCLHKQFSGHYRIAMFGESAWWKGQRTYEQKQERTYQPPPKQEVTKADYFQLFGVRRNVTEAELKSAYRRLARQYHPDLCSLPDATERMQEINLAYEWLKSWVSL